MWYLCASFSALGVLVVLFYLMRAMYNDEEVRNIVLGVVGFTIFAICLTYVLTHKAPWVKEPSKPQIIEETK